MSIAKVECTCRRCGQNFTVTKKCRNLKEATEWEDWANRHEPFGVCRECLQKQQAEENAVAAQQADELQLPELIGSVKQVAWAESIRMKFWNEFQEITDAAKASMEHNPIPEEIRKNIEKFERLSLQAFAMQDEASFYIENRDLGTIKFLHLAIYGD